MGRKVGDTHVSRCDAFKHDVQGTTAVRSARRCPKELIEFQTQFWRGISANDHLRNIRSVPG